MKKGFTLVELICVITILGLIALIAVPTINNMITKSKEDAYEEQITTIEKTARTYMTNNSLFLPKTGSCHVKLATLKQKGYLNNEEILNPKDESELTGVVVVTWNDSNNKYTYEYEDTSSAAECR